MASSNWSCILYDENIVIHCEESGAAYQHFYPLSLLRTYTTKLAKKDSIPIIAHEVPPSRTLTKKFIFPAIHGNDNFPPETNNPPNNHNQHQLTTTNATTTPPTPNPNPFPFPPWYPESAHFVRQWWPSLPNIPRVSCTVVLLAEHDQISHRTRFVLAQHYFRVPVNHVEWDNYNLYGTASGLGVDNGVNGVTPPPPLRPSSSSSSGSQPQPQSPTTSTSTSTTTLSTPAQIAQDDGLMHLWYVSTPFEVVRVFDAISEEDDEDGGTPDRPRPLVAVDFGHAVWIEYVEGGDVDKGDEGEGDLKWLRFVMFLRLGMSGSVRGI